MLKFLLTIKKSIDYSNEKMNGVVRKIKDKEKEAIKQNFKKLNKFDGTREIENLKKNLRLGEWGLGQTKNVYKYDADQYDKEKITLKKWFPEETKYKWIDEVKYIWGYSPEEYEDSLM